MTNKTVKWEIVPTGFVAKSILKNLIKIQEYYLKQFRMFSLTASDTELLCFRLGNYQGHHTDSLSHVLHTTQLHGIITRISNKPKVGWS